MEGLIRQHEAHQVLFVDFPFGKAEEASFVQSVELVADQGKAHRIESRANLVCPARLRPGSDEAERAAHAIRRNGFGCLDELEARDAGFNALPLR